MGGNGLSGNGLNSHDAADPIPLGNGLGSHEGEMRPRTIGTGYPTGADL